MKKKSYVSIVVLAIILSSCTTLGTQQYTYVGDVTKEKNVMGESTHVDFFGLGISAKSYANEYNRAVKDAFDNAEPGATKLKSVKILKEKKKWPQILGITALTVGSIYLSSGTDDFNPIIPLCLFGGGVGLTGMNTYNFIVVGEPNYTE